MSRLEQLHQYLAKLADGGLCVAFSGGVDSAVLLKAACLAAERVHAVTFFTPLHSPGEPAESEALARSFGAVHTVLRSEEIPPDVRANTPERCYFCKRELFRRIRDYAQEHQLQWALDGTNADDRNQYRPGLQALSELGILSPLAELGLGKESVRELARELGLTVAEKPSAPCLATRLPYDRELDESLLRKLDAIETHLRGSGIRQIRARLLGGVVQLEALPEDLQTLLNRQEELIRLVREQGFVTVTLDLRGFRSGSMDELYRWDRRQEDGE